MVPLFVCKMGQLCVTSRETCVCDSLMVALSPKIGSAFSYIGRPASYGGRPASEGDLRHTENRGRPALIKKTHQDRETCVKQQGDLRQASSWTASSDRRPVLGRRGEAAVASAVATMVMVGVAPVRRLRGRPLRSRPAVLAAGGLRRCLGGVAVRSRRRRPVDASFFEGIDGEVRVDEG